MPNRKVSRYSHRRVSNDIWERSYGNYHHQRRPWTDEDIDILLEGFLVHNWKMISTNECFHSELGRTKDAIESQLWKIATRYHRLDTGLPDTAAKYNPISRTLREGTPFSDRDKALIGLALGEGKRNQANDPIYLAKILARSVSEIKEWISDQARKVPGLFREILPGESGWDRDVRLVTPTLKKFASSAFGRV